MRSVYARLRSTLRPVVGASPPAGAVAFLVAEAVFLLEEAEGTWLRATVFLAGTLVVDVVVAFLAPVPVRVGLATVVPDDAEDETLPRRSNWRVAGRGKGDWTDRTLVAARLTGRLVCACDGGLMEEAAEGAARDDRTADPGRAAEVDLSGLDGLSGDMGRDRYDDAWGFSGEARNGDWG